jgi:hypothetical protein
MNQYSIKIGVNYKPIPSSHPNRHINISHFTINGIYVMQYFNVNENNIDNYDTVLLDIIEFVRYLKNEWNDYDWIWHEIWEGYNLNSKSKQILDIFNIAFIKNDVPSTKLWFYTSNQIQPKLYGFNYVTSWPTILNPIDEINSNIDCKIETKIYIQGGRSTETRDFIYNELEKSNLLNSDTIIHTLTLNDYREGGGKKIEWNELIKLVDASFLYVINETDYNANLNITRDYVHFSEKTLIPLMQHKPFVITTGPNYIKNLKKNGFKTFDKWWDESYDEIIDNKERILAVLDIVKYINNKSISELESMKNEMKPILFHNKLQYKKMKENPLSYE